MLRFHHEIRWIELVTHAYLGHIQDKKIWIDLVWRGRTFGLGRALTRYQGSGSPSIHYLCVYHYSGRANQIASFLKITLP